MAKMRLDEMVGGRSLDQIPKEEMQDIYDELSTVEDYNERFLVEFKQRRNINKHLLLLTVGIIKKEREEGLATLVKVAKEPIPKNEKWWQKMGRRLIKMLF